MWYDFFRSFDKPFWNTETATNWNGSDEITAAAGVIVAIVEVNTAGKVVTAGYVESVPKAATN